jgi:hypothetical protein
MNHVKSFAMLLMQPAIAVVPPQVSLEVKVSHSWQLGIAVVLGKLTPLLHCPQPQLASPQLCVLLVPMKTPG